MMKYKQIKTYLFSNYFLNLLIFLFLLIFSNCNLKTSTILKANDTTDLKYSKIIWVVQKDGKAIIFDDKGGSYIHKENISYEYIAGTDRTGKVVEIKLKDVYKIQIETEGSSEYAMWILIPTLIVILVYSSVSSTSP
jgi:hypothetical protein